MSTYQKIKCENGAGCQDNHSDSYFYWFHSIFFPVNICNQWPFTFSIYHWYEIKSRSSKISQIKLTLLLLFLLFAVHKGISSNGTIHNIMADGIFIQNSMIAELNCGMEILSNNHHKHSNFNSSQEKWIFLRVLAYFASYTCTVLGKN